MRRKGRITRAQMRALAELGPRYLLPDEGPLDCTAWFGRTAPLLVEIGFGNGDALVAFAQRHPDWDCLGIEVYDAGVGALLKSIAERELANVGIVHGDAVPVLERRLAEASVDRFHIFFPDPWPKARHHKRRLIQPAFVELLTSRLKPAGVLHLATDWAPYAEHMIEVLAAQDRLQPTAPGQARAATRFEARGERLGHDVFDLAWCRADP